MENSPPKIVIVGCGQLGAHLAVQMKKRGWQVAVVDLQKSAFSRLPTHMQGVCFAGDPLELVVLEDAGTKQAQVLLATTPKDDLNVIIALIGQKAFHVKHAVATVKDPRLVESYALFDIHIKCTTSFASEGMLSWMEEQCEELF